MERKDFLRRVGLAGVVALLPLSRTKAAINKLSGVDGVACILIPGETEGPYVLDLSSNNSIFRQDITEGNTGVPLKLVLTVVNVNDNCNPIANARVDIWHNNKDGYYSGFNGQPGYLGTQNHAGETFLRGIQLTDSNGQVTFATIYPGWYPGRVTHIHFQVFLNSVLKATSQMAFPESITTDVYNTSLYSAHGQNTVTNGTDGVFGQAGVVQAETLYEMLSVTEDGSGGYNGTLRVGVAVPATGIINMEPETGGQFKLGVNYPNPFSENTTIPFTLMNVSDVKVEIFDLAGKKVFEIMNENMSAGEQRIVLDRMANANMLSAGGYLYRLTVQNSNGIFSQCKLLTVL